MVHLILAPKMRDPGTAVLAFDARLETFATEFLDQGRRKKRCDNRETFAGLERIDRSANFREWLGTIGDDRSYIECFKFAWHRFYSSKRFKRKLAAAISAADQNAAMKPNHPPACAIHQFASGVLLAASAGICSSAKSASIRNESSGLSISSATQRSGIFCMNSQRAANSATRSKPKSRSSHALTPTMSACARSCAKHPDARPSARNVAASRNVS